MTNTIINKSEMMPQSSRNPICNGPAKTSRKYPSESALSKNGDWYFPLSPTDLRQRLELLADLQIPCMMYYTSTTGIMHIVSGVIQLTATDNTPFQLANNESTVALPCDNTHRIWLIGTGSNCPDGVVIEIYNRTRNLVARLFSFPEKQMQAIWQDILGNPSLAIA